jgi:hypothetical protein
MVDQHKLAEDIAKRLDFIPADDRLLVKPLKPTIISIMVPVPPKQDSKSIDEAEQSEPTTPQKQRVEANIRKGVVIVLGTDYAKNNPEGIVPGDIVFYHRQSGVAYDLLKDSRLLRRYEVLGRGKAA